MTKGASPVTWDQIDWALDHGFAGVRLDSAVLIDPDEAAAERETAETAIGDDDPDWFGGQGRDEQDIVCALHQGPESDYAVGEAIARDINAPVRRTHRLTSEQMALLEPALAETLTGTMLDTIHEGIGEVVDAGVPETAAYDFLMGHLRIEIGIIIGMTDFPFSVAAQEKIEEARDDLLADDWRDALTLERTKESVEDIAGVE